MDVTQIGGIIFVVLSPLAENKTTQSVIVVFYFFLPQGGSVVLQAY